MKSMASSIQPTLAAASACHCSRVIVRYHGTDAVAVVDIAPGLTGVLLLRTCQLSNYQLTRVRIYDPFAAAVFGDARQAQGDFDVRRRWRQGARFHASQSGSTGCHAQRRVEKGPRGARVLPGGV